MDENAEVRVRDEEERECRAPFFFYSLKAGGFPFEKKNFFRLKKLLTSKTRPGKGKDG